MKILDTHTKSEEDFEVKFLEIIKNFRNTNEHLEKFFTITEEKFGKNWGEKVGQFLNAVDVEDKDFYFDKLEKIKNYMKAVEFWYKAEGFVKGIIADISVEDAKYYLLKFGEDGERLLKRVEDKLNKKSAKPIGKINIKEIFNNQTEKPAVKDRVEPVVDQNVSAENEDASKAEPVILNSNGNKLEVNKNKINNYLSEIEKLNNYYKESSLILPLIFKSNMSNERIDEAKKEEILFYTASEILRLVDKLKSFDAEEVDELSLNKNLSVGFLENYYNNILENSEQKLYNFKEGEKDLKSKAGKLKVLSSFA